MPGLDLSITIVSWNSRDCLRDCLRAICALPDSVSHEVIVWDNASSDGTPDMVAQEFPSVELCASNENLGFGAGHNRAMERATGRYLLMLNPDATVHPHALDELVAFADSHEKGGIFGPKILNPDGSLQYSCRRFPTIEAALFRNTMLGRLFPNNRFASDYLMKSWLHNEPRQVDWVSGSAMMVRRSLLEQLGGFDEQFFMYCEEVDWALRAHQAGWEVWYVPSAVITHIIGRSTDLIANKAIRMFHHSMWLFYKKHTIQKVPLLLRPLVPFGLWLRGTLFILKNQWDALKRWLAR
jgi:GT2 family glycosyltransferase